MMDTPETQATTDPKAAMAIVACFEGFVNYLYPMLVNTSRQHRVLRDALISGAYAPGAPRVFNVYEPKLREISALPFVDRVAQHALCNVIEPIFDKVFLPQSHACRIGKGTHQAARDQFLASWRGHAQWANCRNLLTHLGVLR